MGQLETFTRILKMCMEMMLSITVQLVGGHAEYANIRGPLRSSRSHTAQTPDNMQRVDYMALEDRRVTERNVSPTGNWGSKCVLNIEGVRVEKKFVQNGFRGC
jgi:hypothetical protein